MSRIFKCENCLLQVDESLIFKIRYVNGYHVSGRITFTYRDVQVCSVCVPLIHEENRMFKAEAYKTIKDPMFGIIQ